MTASDSQAVWKKLQDKIAGEVYWDVATRILYATDASLFQQLPAAVVRPKNTDDCTAILNFSNQQDIPVIPRGAGTSLAGQCVGEGLVIDVAYHMKDIGEIDTENACITVEPGVVLQELNNQLRPYKLTFPVDPSTANRCTLGGMVGNNAWGVHTPRHGTTGDHVLSIDALLADGSPVHFSELDESRLKQKLEAETTEGDLYRAVYAAIETHRALILDRLEPAGVLRNNTGYALNSIAENPDWKKRFNLAPLLCGSEGTLALITGVTLSVSPLTTTLIVVCAHFMQLSDAIAAVPEIADLKPNAIELLDQEILTASAESASQQQNRFWIEGDPQAVLLIECESDAQSVRIRKKLQHKGCYASPIFAEPDAEKVWALRRASLAMLMGREGKKKAVSACEDAAVPLHKLLEYFQQLSSLINRYALDCVYYGPVSVGVIHIRPWMDLSQQDEKQRFVSLLKDMAHIVADLGGVITSKHGDGRVRGWLLRQMIGDELYIIFESIKSAVDPKGLLNPGTLLTDKLPDEHLRVSGSQPQTAIQTVFSWAQEGGFHSALQKCNGAAVCLKPSGNGVMCPSYQASRQEQHVTRGRANTLRIMIQRNGIDGLVGEEVQQALEFCLACKACKTECPAAVDMAKLKAEVQQQRHDQHGTPLRTRLLGGFYAFSKLASKASSLMNPVFGAVAPGLLGLHQKRRLPLVAKQSFADWLKYHRPHPDAGSKGSVVLFNDPLINYYEPNIGIAAIETLECLGYQVAVSPCLSTGQLLISQGLLRKAKTVLRKTVTKLSKLSEQGQPVIGLEPSELLTLRDEASDLLGDELSSKAAMMVDSALIFEEFILQNVQKTDLPKQENPPGLLIHEHCHQKALAEPDATQNCLSLIADAETIPAGCCGMAGVFGYEKTHYDLSMQIGELELFPAIRNAYKETWIVATGASCRKQILDGTGRHALHAAEVFKKIIVDNL